jgi:hypothetical protein
MAKWEYKVLRVPTGDWMPDVFLNTKHETASGPAKLLADLAEWGDEILSVTPVEDGTKLVIVARREGR